MEKKGKMNGGKMMKKMPKHEPGHMGKLSGGRGSGESAGNMGFRGTKEPVAAKLNKA